MSQDILYYDEDGDIIGDSEYLQRMLKESFDYHYRKWEDVKPEELTLILTDPSKGPQQVIKRFRWKDSYDNKGNFIGNRQPRKCPTCAKYGLENHKLNRDDYNDGTKNYWWADCDHYLWERSENRHRARLLNGYRYKQHQLNHPPLEKKVKKKWWQFWKAEEFRAPFMDISNYGEKLIQAKTMYHGQAWSEHGYNDVPHSEYWTTSFEHALGHALFGPDMEGDSKAIECSVCEGFGYYFPDDAPNLGRVCEYCVKGWTIPLTYADDYIPAGKPVVWALDVSDNYIPFIYDGENPIGVSYIYNSKDSAESLEWYAVSDSRIIKTLHRWIAEDEVPEIVLEDTSAGYVSDESVVWKRIVQALGQLGQ